MSRKWYQNEVDEEIKGVDSSELRRLPTDLIWCYKIVFGLVRLNFGDFLKFCPVPTTRGHPYELYTSHCTSIRSRFIAHRVIKAWNSLPQSTNFSSLAAFKRSILQTDHSKHLTMFFVRYRGVDCLV